MLARCFIGGLFEPADKVSGTYPYLSRKVFHTYCIGEMGFYQFLSSQYFLVAMTFVDIKNRIRGLAYLAWIDQQRLRVLRRKVRRTETFDQMQSQIIEG
jgi:hypothetical protein